jgi:hypothetical protein
MKVKKTTVVFDMLAAVAFIINGLLWYTSGNKLSGILFLLPAVLFLAAGFIQIRKLKKDSEK